MTNSCHIIDLKTWDRAELFRFYRKFAAPCFNISVKVKAEPIYRYAGTHHESFFLLALYAILRAANRIPQLRRRIINDQPVEFEKIAAMTPIMTRHAMFHQIWCDYHDTFSGFKAAAEPKIEAAKADNPHIMAEHGEDFICASCLPWLHFESMAQAEYGFDQCIPILSWGKLEGGLVPVSAKFNHCFVDGWHVSNFFAEIERAFSAPETLM